MGANDRFRVSMQIPGISKGDLRLAITDKGIEVKAEKQGKSESAVDGMYRFEKNYFRFYRFIAIPEHSDVSKAVATFDNGALDITIPQKQIKTRRIQIQ